MSDSSYYANRRPEVMAFIPANAQRILEIGCGKGAFRANFPTDIEYWGVEPHKQSAIVARSKMSRVLTGGLFDVASELPDDHFDLIICNDVIEHIADTQSLMTLMRKKLVVGGSIAGSIPNVRHAEHLYQLLVRRNWTYRSSGVLDRTHLRFFTRNSIEALMSEHGFDLVELSGINLDLPWEDGAPQFKRRAWQTLLGSDSRALQFGFSAKKTHLPEKDRLGGQSLYTQEFDNQNAYAAYIQSDKDTLKWRNDFDLQQEVQDLATKAGRLTYNGYCSVCQRHQHLLSDLPKAGHRVDWRDQLICVGCGLNSRARLAHFIVLSEADRLNTDQIYLTEQMTELAGALEYSIPRLMCSEYISADMPPGTETELLIRHEDLTRLSLADACMSVIGCFDVLNHIPDFRCALTEMARVLRPGGVAVISVPLQLDEYRTVSIDTDLDTTSQTTIHHRFGWDLLETATSCGFSKAVLRTYWSSDLAHLGTSTCFILASR